MEWGKRIANNLKISIAFTAFMTAIYFASLHLAFLPVNFISASPVQRKSGGFDELSLRLRIAADKDKTVIITWVNEAWAKEGSMLDLFLRSFEVGINTRPLLKHLLIVAVDPHAMERCRAVHPHCYLVTTQADYSNDKAFMSTDYINMMWRRLAFFAEIIERGYNYVFTDVDIMWLRNPFLLERFYRDADIQMACDRYRGSARDMKNIGNGGLMYVRANAKTVSFLRYWHASRSLFPEGTNEQDVFNVIKAKEMHRRRLVLKFLDTRYFGGYCQRGWVMDMDKTCTLHANCCKGLSNKINDLRKTLSDWSVSLSTASTSSFLPLNWTQPNSCRKSMIVKKPRHRPI